MYKNINPKRLFLSTFIFFIFLLQYPCKSQNNSKKITIASSGKIESIDPARANTLKSLQLLYSLGDTLYELNGEGDLIPKLASSMPIFSRDKLKVSIELRENIFFHDGTPFNSEAMKFTIERFQKIGTTNYILRDKIKSIETPNEYTLVINFNKPSTSIEGLLTSVNLTPISPTAYKDYHDKFLNDDFIGTGAYSLRRFSKEIQILDENLNYWGPKPKNNGINFVGYSNSSSLYGALISKQIDVLLSNSIDDSQRNKLRSLSENNKLKEGSSEPTEITFLSLRTNSPPFDNKEIRLAIAKSLNRELISQKISYDQREPAYSIIPPILNNNKQGSWPKYSPKDAIRIFRNQGYCDGNTLNLSLTYRSNVPNDKLIALAWQQDLKNNMEDCFSLTINGVESTTIYKNISEGIYSAVILDWTGAYSDPEAYLKPLLSCNYIEGNNCSEGESVFSGSFWGSNKVEKLFLKSESLTGEARLDKLYKIEEIAAEEIPYIPIWISSQKAWGQNNISKPIFNGAGIILMSEFSIIK